MTDHDMTTTPWQLARIAGCSDPDSATSPGAVFLLDIAAAVAERDQYPDDDSDAAAEIADGAVPVYTAEVWRVFVDLGAWQEDATELGADASDMEQCAKVCLYLIAERLAGALIAEQDDSAADDADMSAAEQAQCRGWEGV